MSTEKVEHRPSAEPSTRRQERSETVELEKKIMQIEEEKYSIEARQNGDSRFCRIIELKESRNSRVVVPMCMIGEFIKKLEEVNKFLSTYVPKGAAQKKSPRDRSDFAFMTSFVTVGGRRYYFDLIDAEPITLRVSYIFAGRRDNVHMVVEAATSLIDILGDFLKKFPSLTPSDDYPASTWRRNGGYGRGGRGMDRAPRGYGRGRRFNRPYNSNRGSGYYNGASAQTPKQPIDPKRAANLKVLSEPAPSSVSHNAKKFTVEIVEGANTFVRVTEIINDTRKSTIHVPIEVCPQFQSLFSDMFKKYSTIQKTNGSGAAPK